MIAPFEVDETHVGYKRLYCEGRERIKPVQSWTLAP